jgi:glutamate N-acetyltransferase/amino-acid N-acetyltransferase
MAAKISPLAPAAFPQLQPIEGVRLVSVEAGIKYRNRKDVTAIFFDKPAQAAGVFTRSLCPSAPVDWCRRQLAGGVARCVVVNSGNANAFTGRRGVETVEATAKAAAAAAGCKAKEVFIASTGVIGEPLDASRFAPLLADAHGKALADNWAQAAQAIMTTDTYPKLATRSFTAGGREHVINGIAKGAGMIAPDMATMLSFAVTDLPVDAAILQDILAKEVGPTFNAITVDSDTSTSDTLMLFSAANGAKRISDKADPRLRPFRKALRELLHELAMLVIRDGEGATKLVGITITGAASASAAKRVALSVANSPLVKTAIAGEDANWGRVVMAIGKAGEKADRDSLSISFNGIRVAHMGMRDPAYDEAVVSKAMEAQEISIHADLGVGRGKATVWTCDLTKEYVAINGDYRS